MFRWLKKFTFQEKKKHTLYQREIRGRDGLIRSTFHAGEAATCAHVLLIPEHSLPSETEPTVASRARKKVLSIVERERSNHCD